MQKQWFMASLSIRLTTIVLLAAASFSFESKAQSTDITLLHTNDLHSRMLGYSPNSDYTPYSINDDPTVGGMARLATIADSIRRHADNVLLVDAGDFLMGTVFQTLETQSGFQLHLMKTMEYDVISIGNHEFDFGIDGLVEIIHAARAQGEIPPLVLSNIQFCDSLEEDDDFEALYQEQVITTWHIVERGGIKIGFFGLLGKDAYEVAPYAKPLTTTDQITTAKEMNTFLRTEKQADIVIALSHSGVFKNKTGEYEREDVDVAKAVPELNLIISAHTHTTLYEPLIINGVPIVQTGAYGSNMGEVVLHYENGTTTLSSARLIAVDDSWEGKPEIQHAIETQMELINQKVLGNLGLRADSLLVESAFPIRINDETLLENSNLGPFVADAVYHYFQKNDPDGVNITLVAAGLLRDDILPGIQGFQYVSDLYRILPLGRGVTDKTSPGYSLAKIYITGRELKNILEIMQIAPSLSTSNYPYWTGVRYATNPLRLPLDKIYEVELGTEEKGFTKISLSKNDSTLYSLGANAYLLEFVSLIKDLSKGILSVVPKNKNGIPIQRIEEALVDLDPENPGIQEAKEWAALMEFCASFPDINNNGIPDIPQQYSLEHMLVVNTSVNNTDPYAGSMINDQNQQIINSRSPKKSNSTSLRTVFTSGNGVTLVAYAVILVIVFLFVLLIRVIIKRIKKTK